MTVRVYILPLAISVTRRSGVRWPKYIYDEMPGVSLSLADYGPEDWCIVAADVDATQHTSISGNADVLALPTNLDANLTAGAVTAAMAFLEAFNMPAGWITTAFTYRQVLKIVGAAFQFLQVWSGLGGGKVFGGGVTLSTTFSQLPVAARNRLLAAAQQLNYDTSSLSAASTLRQIIKAMADQWAGTIHLGMGVDL